VAFACRDPEQSVGKTIAGSATWIEGIVRTIGIVWRNEIDHRLK
jgi:hypothetical protein